MVDISSEREKKGQHSSDVNKDLHIWGLTREIALVADSERGGQPSRIWDTIVLLSSAGGNHLNGKIKESERAEDDRL